jgi:hypothetical protein
VVGDTFPTGCAYASDIIFSEFFLENADANHPVYSTKVSSSSLLVVTKCGMLTKPSFFHFCSTACMSPTAVWTMW